MRWIPCGLCGARLLLHPSFGRIGPELGSTSGVLPAINESYLSCVLGEAVILFAHCLVSILPSFNVWNEFIVTGSISHLVDPASSHMLVSKIKPCMSQNMLFLTNLQMAHYNSHSLIGCCGYMDTYGNSIANTCLQSQLIGRVVLISSRTRPSIAWFFGDS